MIFFKYIIALVIIIIIPTQFVVSQNQNSISYFDKKGYLTYKDSALYYRQETDTFGYFRSYYKKTKQIYFEGKIIAANDSTDAINKYSGLCKWFYPNGKIKRTRLYDNNGNLNGMQYDFFKNGTIYKERKYINNEPSAEFIEYEDQNTDVAMRIFEDSFDDNNNNWKLNKEENTHTKIKIGGIELNNVGSETYCSIIPYHIDSSNFSIETKINSRFLTKDCVTGIVFGYRNKLNYNYFFVSKYRYSTGVVINGQIIQSSENYFSYDLEGDNWNTLKIECVRDSFYYFINNKLQLYKQRDSIIGDCIGFNITNGRAFYDYINVKQYKRTHSMASKKESRFFEPINSTMFPVLKTQSGITLNSRGYILATLRDMNQVNNIIIEIVINDTIKTFFADIYLKNELLNFAILKIRSNSSLKLNSPNYSYSYVNTIDTEKNFILKFCKKSNENLTLFNHNAIYGKDKKIVDYKYNEQSDDLINSAPIFDAKGNLLGLFDKLNDKGTVEMIKLQQIYSKLELNMLEEVSRFPLNEKELAEKNVFKNIVILKIL